jgi:hypothetical protein
MRRSAGPPPASLVVEVVIERSSSAPSSAYLGSVHPWIGVSDRSSDLAALGAFGGSWLQRLGSKESETWQNLRDLDRRIHSSVDPYERQSCAEHVRELLRIGKLTATQRAYARTSAAVYEARLRDET